MRNDRGEISIPTILTVIVLIILGGICIFMLTGENGLFVPKRYEQNNTTINENQTENVEGTDKSEDNTVTEKNETQTVQNTTNNNVLTVPMQ